LRGDPAPPEDEADVHSEAELQKRDALIDPVLAPLVRRLKRQLQDEQNDVLDRLRSGRGTPTVDDALGTDADHTARYEAVAYEAVTTVGRAGAEPVGSAPDDVPGLRAISAALAFEITRPVRRSVSRALGSGTDDDEQALADGVGAAYREWRTTRIEKLASDHLSAAYVAGVFAAGGGRKAVWVVDDGGEPCPDCDDNSLAGPTPIGEAFPTGQLLPPAHPGCRCLLVPR